MSIFSEADLDRLRSYYPEQPGKLSHRLTGHPLLTLESLVELGKRLPRASVEYNAGDLPYGVDPDEVEPQRPFGRGHDPRHRAMRQLDGAQECRPGSGLQGSARRGARRARRRDRAGVGRDADQGRLHLRLLAGRGDALPPRSRAQCPAPDYRQQDDDDRAGRRIGGAAGEARGLSCRRPPQRALAGRL